MSECEKCRSGGKYSKYLDNLYGKFRDKIGNVIIVQAEREGPMNMAESNCRALICGDPEDMYGPCGCGMDMATLPILIPKTWIMEDKPLEVEEHGFGTDLDYRRPSGLDYDCVPGSEIENIEYLANFSCCKDCAERAVKCGYAEWF